jgi:Tfp pilus assembly protein PilF
MSPIWKQQRVLLGAYIFMAVMLLRVIVLARLTNSPFLLPAHGDMHFYNDWALRILRGEWTDHLAFYGLPLYPYLLAGIYNVFGYNPFMPALLQAGLDGATAAIIYQLAIRIFDPGETADAPNLAARGAHRNGEIIGVFAGLGWGLFTPAQAYSVILMPAAWLVCVFWFVVWQIVARRQPPGLIGILLLGILVGITAMGVANILFLVPLLVAAIYLKWEMSGKRARILGTCAIMAGTVLGALPAFAHNYIVARDPVFLSAHGGVNFWIGNNPWANGYPRFPPGLHAGQEAMLQDSITGAESAVGHPLKRSEVSAYWSAKAQNYIAHNFGQWLRLLVLKFANFWNAFRYDDLSVITTLCEEGVILPGLPFGLVAALAIPGFLLAFRRFALSRWVAAAIALHIVSLLGVFVTERYRLAAVPGLLLFAAFGVWDFWNSCVIEHYRRIFVYVALVMAATSFVSQPKREASLWALDSYNTGLQALDLNHLDVAQQKLNLAYAYVPDNAELNFALGNLRLARGDRDAAKSYYFTTLSLDPRHEGSYNNLGVLALEENRGDLAADLFAKALRQNPRDAKTYYLLARSHLAVGDLKSARVEIEQAVKLAPRQPELQALKDDLQKQSTSP